VQSVRRGLNKEIAKPNFVSAVWRVDIKLSQRPELHVKLGALALINLLANGKKIITGGSIPMPIREEKKVR